MVIFQNWLFDFVKTVVMNPKNHPNHRWGLFL
jgi:hypothetical protein